MPAIEHSLPIIGHLPDPIREMMRRRARELVGLGLIAASVAVITALATWSVQDPSLSHATSHPTRNLLGYPGAIIADLLMQIFGIGSVLVVLPIAIWGLRLIAHRLFDRQAVRVGCWVVAIVVASGFASCWTPTPSWPLPTGLGGVVGDALLRVPAMILGPLGLLSRLGIGVLLGLTMAASFLVATRAGPRASDALVDEPEVADLEETAEPDGDDERSSRWITLGWLIHEMLTIKARANRIFGRAYRWLVANDEEAPAGRFDRMEPSMRAGARETATAPAVHSPDADEEDLDAEEPAAKAPRKRAPRPVKASGKFVLPPLSVLAAPRASDRFTPSADAIAENARILEGVLQDFGVRGEITNAHPGPVVTLYELEPAPGIKSSRVIGLADDIARSMSAISARVAVVAGRNAIGIELPNPHREKVYLRELLAAKDFNESVAKLPLCLGKTIGGDHVIVDLARMPHLLIAGTTGSGKSVAINTMILSLVYRLKPEQCRLIMVDPKMLELSVYDGIPHLLTPVVTDPKKAVVALKWAVREMEERYKNMAKLGVRNIDGYNARLAEAKARGEELTRTVHTGFDKDTGKAIYEEERLDLEPLPYIVVIVDEMADLMMVAGKDIEGAVQRLAQMARAAGLHVVLATQRPSVDVITGTIKANFPTRISFQVTSKIDSRTILGEQGAEQLLGQGDMLYMAGGGRISRVHGPFVSDEEVEKVVRHLKAQGVPQYLEAVTADEEEDGDEALFDATGMGGGDDLYSQAVQIVKRDRKASTSYIQRRLQIGYNRAATIMERMEEEGIVGQANHAGKREILIGED